MTLFNFNKSNQLFSEEHIQNQTITKLRFKLLISLVIVIVVVLALSFGAGYTSSKWDAFNETIKITGSGVLAIFSSIVAYYFGVDAGKKEQKLEDQKAINQLKENK